MAEFNLRMQKYHEGSVLGLRLYMFTFWMSYQNRRFFESYLPAFRKLKDKKKFHIIAFELLKLTLIWKCLPYHYFRYGLYQKKFSFKKILDFLPETIFYYQILPKINKQMFLLDDKSIFEDFLKGQGILYPKTILKIIKGTTFDNNSHIINSESNLKKVLNNSKSNILFCKPSDCGSGGKDIFILKRSGDHFYDNVGKTFDYEFIKILRSSDWIVQEGVENSHSISKFYKHSTNSFRVLTYFTPGLGSRVMYCILKFGNNKAYTDNAHTGGVYVRVDIKTGELDDIAYDENLHEYKSHPFTGIIFAGHKVNGIKEVIEMAVRLGNKFPNLTFVGWDIALSSKGAMVLEGNSSPGLTIIQRTYGGMKDFIKLTNTVK